VDDGWLSLQEVADACGATYRTVYRMVRRGELPARSPRVARTVCNMQT
jgi:excisionase family DNA binding protein